MQKFGAEVKEIIYFQGVLNIIMLSSGAAMFFCTALAITENRLRSVLGVSLLFFTWPYLVMPVYYPMLSDHISLWLVIAAIFFWIRRKLVPLFVVLSYSVFVMPGLFIVAFVLASFKPVPMRNDYLEIKNKNQWRWRVLGVTLGSISVLFFVYLMNSVDDSLITTHAGGGEASLRFFSLIFVNLFLFFLDSKIGISA